MPEESRRGDLCWSGGWHWHLGSLLEGTGFEITQQGFTSHWTEIQFIPQTGSEDSLTFHHREGRTPAADQNFCRKLTWPFPVPFATLEWRLLFLCTLLLLPTPSHTHTHTERALLLSPRAEADSNPFLGPKVFTCNSGSPSQNESVEEL